MVFRGRKRFFQDGGHVQEHCGIFANWRQNATRACLLRRLFRRHSKAAGKTPQGDPTALPTSTRLTPSPRCHSLQSPSFTGIDAALCLVSPGKLKGPPRGVQPLLHPRHHQPGGHPGRLPQVVSK